jgi:hypothetical protein
MYSNQKDQISLEEAYRNVHNDTINEDANETIGGSILYGTLLLPILIDYLAKKYPQVGQKLSSIKDYLKNKISSDETLNTKKQNADEHGGEGATDYYNDLNKKIAMNIKDDQTFRSAIDNAYEKTILQDIVNLLPKNLTNKNEQQAKIELNKNIQQDVATKTQDQKRKEMGLPPVPTIRG